MRKQKYVLLGLLSVILIGTVVFAGDIEMKINGAADAVTIDKSDGSEAMRITADGKVGIGTTVPTAPLVIKSSSTDRDVSKYFQWKGIELKTQGANYGESSSIDFTNNNGYLSRLSSYGEGTGNGGSLYFMTTDDHTYANLDVKMVVKNNGNVGIGTTTPQTRLDVNGLITQQGSNLALRLTAKSACQAAAGRLGITGRIWIAGNGEDVGTLPQTVCDNQQAGTTAYTRIYIYDYTSNAASFDYNSISAANSKYADIDHPSGTYSMVACCRN